MLAQAGRSGVRIANVPEPIRAPGPVALVLAGGGARGAYEAGALAELLPALPPGERPEILVGTSVGGLNVSYYAATAHEPVAQQVADATELWSSFDYDDVLEPVLSLSTASRLKAYAQGVLGIPGAEVPSVLDPAPLAETMKRVVDFDALNANSADGTLKAAAVAATSADSNLTVVFHTGDREIERDVTRGIEYVRTELTVEHVMASAAIPAIFPAVEVTHGPGAGWYFDGGTRLNTPIKPAIALGAGRVILVALNSLSRRRGGYTTREPGLFEGIGQVLQALLVDPLVNDVHTMARRNELLAAAGSTPGSDEQELPYILICPTDPDEIALLATRLFGEHHGHLTAVLRNNLLHPSGGNLALLGRILHGGSGVAHGELLSLLYFAREFLDGVMALGRRDALAWLDGPHDDGLWQLGRIDPGDGHA